MKNIPVSSGKKVFLATMSAVAILSTTGVAWGQGCVVAQGGLRYPKRARTYNASIGLGVSMPTGRDDVKNNVVASPGAAPVLTTVDYSIQPGQGAWGTILQWQAFKSVGKSVFYTNG